MYRYVLCLRGVNLHPRLSGVPGTTLSQLQTRSLRHLAPDTHFPAFLEKHWERLSDKAFGKCFSWRHQWNNIRPGPKMVLDPESLTQYQALDRALADHSAWERDVTARYGLAHEYTRMIVIQRAAAQRFYALEIGFLHVLDGLKYFNRILRVSKIPVLDPYQAHVEKSLPALLYDYQLVQITTHSTILHSYDVLLNRISTLTTISQLHMWSVLDAHNSIIGQLLKLEASWNPAGHEGFMWQSLHMRFVKIKSKLLHIQTHLRQALVHRECQDDPRLYVVAAWHELLGVYKRVARERRQKILKKTRGMWKKGWKSSQMLENYSVDSDKRREELRKLEMQ